MEEDIKLLEEKIDKMKTGIKVYRANQYIDMANIMEREKQALENLIKGYRELKEGCKTCVIRDDLHEYVENSIPKSKIKEKIEELKGYSDLARKMIEHRVVIADSDSINFGRAEAHNKDIEVLQEMLGDEE